MSYVLDALRKAEKDRRKQPDLGLHNLDQDEWNKPPDLNKNSLSSIWIIWFLLILICVSIVGVQFRSVAIEEAETQTAIENDLQLIVVADDSATESRVFLEEPSIEPSAETLQPEPVAKLAARITEFRFEGNLYIEGNPTANRVFINGGAYKMGDALEGDIYLLEIGANSVTLSDGYDQVIQPLR
jgi:hypothetical protein|tara:strand:+ start:93175 stop:93729 length:555 start_codon:yes stop_codon:yes gene_type:complete